MLSRIVGHQFFLARGTVECVVMLETTHRLGSGYLDLHHISIRPLAWVPIDPAFDKSHTPALGQSGSDELEITTYVEWPLASLEAATSELPAYLVLDLNTNAVRLRVFLQRQVAPAMMHPATPTRVSGVCVASEQSSDSSGLALVLFTIYRMPLIGVGIPHP